MRFGRRVFVIAVLASAPAFALAGAARSGLSNDAVGGVHDVVQAEVSVQTDTVASGTTLVGVRKWDVGMGELNGGTLTDPTVSVASGYQPSQLADCCGEPFTSLPIVQSNPGGSSAGFEITSALTATLQPRCDTSRSVSPLQVPVTGGQQTVTLTVRCTDPAVTSIEPSVSMGSGTAGPEVSVVSFSPPANLDQGEDLCLSGCPNGGGGGNGGGGKPVGVGFELDNIVTGKQYTFTVVFNTENPFGVPFAQKPGVSSTDTSGSSPCFACGPQSSITFADPTLDGPIPGAGQVTLSAGEPHGWDLFADDDREIDFDGTQSSPLSYAGNGSGTDDQAVTLAAAWSGGGGLDGTPVTFTLGSQSCTGTTSFGAASCTITLAQPVGAYTLGISSPGDISVYPSTASASFSITGPTSTDQCKNGGWQTFGIFKNPGDCVSYVATGGKNPPNG